jgi:hypothetical protein
MTHSGPSLRTLGQSLASSATLSRSIGGSGARHSLPGRQWLQAWWDGCCGPLQ